MINLNNLDEIKKLDPQNTLTSTEQLIQQCKAAWEEVNALDLPKHEEGVKNIVCCGLGASLFGGLALKALLGTELQFPIEFVSDYFLPDYVGKESLVVLTSYSGTSEEILSCAEDALAKEAKIVVITQGGKLAEFAKNHKLPAYLFDGKHNPSGVPRLGNGYSIFGLLGLLNKINIIDIQEHEISNAFIRFEDDSADIKTQVQKDFQLFTGKLPIIIAAEHLSANANILRNQFNETSKTFSAHFLLPDLNHHLMEGLQFPKDASLHFFVLNSQNYSQKIQRRVALTIDVIRQNGYPVHEFVTAGATVYDDFLEVLQYGSFLTLYLGFSYEQNPAENPWVDWFKERINLQN